MAHWLHRFTELALAAAVGCAAAYALLEMRDPAPARMAGATVALVATGARAPLGLPPSDVAGPTAPGREQPVVIATYRDAVARAAPSVVTVHSAHRAKGGLPIGPKALVPGLGSGVIVSRDGDILTNYHVVEDASELAVALADGTLHLARVVGADAESDLALLKIDAEGLPPIAMADINDVAAGDVVLAVGNPLGMGQTVTQGVVSAVVRKGVNRVENFIQTDAAINRGNSGGALIDTAGRLIGINTAILSHSGGSEGLGFAIPVDLVQTVAAALKTKGRVPRAWLGVSTGRAPAGQGALVLSADAAGPAANAGIVPGDVIVRIGEKNVRHPQDVRAVVIGIEPGTLLPIELARNGRRATVNVLLSQLPTNVAAP